MMTRGLLSAIVACLPLLAAGSVRADPAAAKEGTRGPAGVAATRAEAALPSEAHQLVETFDRQRQIILEQAEKQIAPHRRQLVRRLEALQDRYCRAGQLDQALAVRARIWQLLGIRADPGNLSASVAEIGEVYHFAVTGSASGSVWGTKVYTSDSDLATAATHSGALRLGQSGVVRVQILPGQKSYQGSRQHGVESHEYGPWQVSFSVEAGRP